MLPEPNETMTPIMSDSPTSVASKVSFDSPLGPPKLEAAGSKSSRMNFLKRKVKSRDEDDEDIDEMEIKKLEKKVELLKKKRQLVLKIKKIERGIETGDIDSDDDTTLNKGSPKRWSSLKPRKWKKRSDSFDDELTYDDDDSPFIQRFHHALDCIEDGCSPVINEIANLDAMCHDRASRNNDESIYVHDLRDETSDTNEEATVPAGNTEDDMSKSPQTSADPKTLGLAAPIVMLAKSLSQSVTGAGGVVGASLESDKHSSGEAESQEKPDSNEASKNEKAMVDTQEVEATDNADDSENNLGWMDKAASALRSHSFAHTNDDNDVGLDCFEMLSSQPKSEGAFEQSEMDAKFAKVTLTAMNLSGLSITSKKGGKSAKNHDVVPPVHVVLSVLNNDESSPFVHIPSLQVVKDPSRVASKKNSSKSHVMGVWCISKESGASRSEDRNSSVSFSRLVGLSMIEGENEARSGKNTAVKMSPSMLHLRVCITREGSEELLPIGVAKVLVSGGPREKELAIPLKPEYYKSMEELVKKLNTKPPQSKWESFKTFVMEDEDEVMSCVRFKGHKNEVYRLEKDAFIRVNIKVTNESRVQDQAHSQMAAWFPSAAAPDSAGNNDGNHTSGMPSTPEAISSEIPQTENEASDNFSPAIAQHESVVTETNDPINSSDKDLDEQKASAGKGRFQMSFFAKSKKGRFEDSPAKTDSKVESAVTGDSSGLDGQLGGVVVAGAATGLALVASSQGSRKKEEGDENEVSRDGPFSGIHLDTNEDSPEVKSESANRLEAANADLVRRNRDGKKSWFGKIKKARTGVVDRKQTIDDPTEVEAVPDDSSAAKGLVLTGEEEKSISDGAVATKDQQQFAMESPAAEQEEAGTSTGGNANKVVSVAKISNNTEPSKPITEDLAKNRVTVKSKKSWFKMNKKNSTPMTAAPLVQADLVEEQETDECDESHAVEGAQRSCGTHANGVMDTEVEDGIEMPPLNTSIASLSDTAKDDSSTSMAAMESSKPGQGRRWFMKSKKDSVPVINSSEPTKSKHSESPSPSRSEKTGDTETSHASSTSCSDDDLSPVKNDTAAGIGSVDSESQTTRSSKKWSLKKSLIPRQLQRARALSSHRTPSDSYSGSSVLTVATTTGLGAALADVGLSNQNIHDSNASFEVLRNTNGELNPVIAETEESTTPFFCNVDEMIETDVTMDVTQSANCIKQDDVSVVSNEDGKAIPLEDEASTENGSHCIANIGVVNDLEGDNSKENDHYNLSECNCEECMNKRAELSSDDGECQGIELELKPESRRSDTESKDMLTSKKSLMSMSNLTSKLARSKSRRAG